MEFQPYSQEPQGEAMEGARALPTGGPGIPEAGVVRKRRGGCGFWFMALLAVVFLGTTVIALLALFAVASGAGDVKVTGADSGRGVRFVEHTIQGSGDAKILLLPITGVITDVPYESFMRSGPGMVSTIRDMLDAARRDKDIKAIILGIDSPGGGITASDVLHHSIETFRKETGLPVVAVLGDVGASGGYYVACAAERIVAHPTTVTGSIGVIIPLIGIENLLQKIGVEVRPIKSGEAKDMGSAYRSMAEKERKMLQAIVDEYLERFIGVVAAGFERRGVSTSGGTMEEYCDGRVFTGRTALDHGFVDELGYFETGVAAARQLASLAAGQTRVVTYRRKPGLLDLIWGATSVTRPRGLTLNLEGVANGESPRFLYLWTTRRGEGWTN